MNTILKILLSAIAVFVLAHVLPNVSVDGYLTAIVVAIAISLLNLIVRPILVILTIPITIVTLGLFLLIINALMIAFADYFIEGFKINGFLWTIIFSILLSIFQSILNKLLNNSKKKK